MNLITFSQKGLAKKQGIASKIDGEKIPASRRSFHKHSEKFPLNVTSVQGHHF
jgi:hypothetical protein